MLFHHRLAKRAFKEMRLDVLHGRPLDIILSGEVSQPRNSVSSAFYIIHCVPPNHHSIFLLFIYRLAPVDRSTTPVNLSLEKKTLNHSIRVSIPSFTRRKLMKDKNRKRRLNRLMVNLKAPTMVMTIIRMVMEEDSILM